MKSIVTAMGNPTLNNELKRYAEYDVIGDDLFYQEAVTDLLETTKVEVLALSGILQGQWDLIEFIERVQKVCVGIRIIVIMDEITSDVKCELLERGIQDIFLDDRVEIQDILEAINREEPLLKKLEANQVLLKEKEEQLYDVKKVHEINKVIQKQEVIAICGTNGTGKSTITYHLSRILASKSNSKILVIDFDTFSGNLDERYGVNKIPPNIELQLDLDKKCGINYAADLINKNRFDTNVFDELVIRAGNVDLLTGNTSLYFCQDVLNESIYEVLLNSAKEKYDFIILDTSSNIFLDATKWCVEKATKVIFLVENDYLSIKKTNQFLDIIVKTWGVWKDKIYIVVNKERATGVESDVIQKIFENYLLIGSIKQNEEESSPTYEKILEKFCYIPKKGLTDKLHVLQRNIRKSLEKNWDKKMSQKKEWATNVN